MSNSTTVTDQWIKEDEEENPPFEKHRETNSKLTRKSELASTSNFAYANRIHSSSDSTFGKRSLLIPITALFSPKNEDDEYFPFFPRHRRSCGSGQFGQRSAMLLRWANWRNASPHGKDVQRRRKLVQVSKHDHGRSHSPSLEGMWYGRGPEGRGKPHKYCRPYQLIIIFFNVGHDWFSSLPRIRAPAWVIRATATQICATVKHQRNQAL